MEQQSVKEEVAPSENPSAEQQTSDKEVNLRRLAQAKERAEMALEKERAEKADLMQRMQQMEATKSSLQEDDDLEDDGYVESKKLKKTLSRFEQKLEQKFDQRVEEKARRMMDEERKKDMAFRQKTEMPDFDKVVTDEAAHKFEESFPEWAQTILQQKDEYVRRKLAYEAIKGTSVNLSKKDNDVQERVNKNQRNTYLVPEAIGSGVIKAGGDFSETGKKSAYQQMKNLQKGMSGR